MLLTSPFSITPLLAILLTSVGSVVGQDIVYDAIHNATVLTGTWSSGSKAVMTGSGFANPANQSFVYPKTTGISYSFSGDGFYEISRYRFNSNGSEPTCITGVIGWVHGKYQLLGNGSIVLTPLGDGYQQVQDPCGAVSNFIENYNLTELYQSWRIYQDPQSAEYHLHLFQYDGAPLAPQTLISPDPTMLPKKLLRNVTGSSTGGLTTQNALAINSASSVTSRTGAIGMIVGTFGIGIVSLLLL